MNVLGVDPGIDGGLAKYRSGSFTDADMELIVTAIPKHKSPKGRGEETNWAELIDIFDVLFDDVDHAFVERVGAMPGNGASSMFKFGYVCGGVRGIIAARRIPITMVEPARWKHAMGLGKSKDAAVARACQLFPKNVSSFKGPRGGNLDGPAEAALIAKYGHNALLNPSK